MRERLCSRSSIRPEAEGRRLHLRPRVQFNLIETDRFAFSAFFAIDAEEIPDFGPYFVNTRSQSNWRISELGLLRSLRKKIYVYIPLGRTRINVR